jgi:hypothetical protein
MRVLVAALADYANIAVGDKLNLSGVFDTIWVRQFPSVHPQMFLALRLEFDYDDGGRDHALQVIVENQDGKQFTNATARMGIAPIAPGTRLVANQILAFQQINLLNRDVIAFRLLWDGKEAQRVMLNVEQLPEQPPQESPGSTPRPDA